jgi:hypothetical protein
MSLTFHCFLPANGIGRDLGACPNPRGGVGLTELTLPGCPRAEGSYWFGEGALSITEPTAVHLTAVHLTTGEEAAAS